MINWKLDALSGTSGQLTLFDCMTGAAFLIRFADPDQLRKMLGDIIVGTRSFDAEETPLPECVRREFPGRD